MHGNENVIACLFMRRKSFKHTKLDINLRRHEQARERKEERGGKGWKGEGERDGNSEGRLRKGREKGK